MNTSPLEGSVLLVTGGTGSFGRRVATHLADFCNALEIRIFSRDEKKQADMQQEFPDFRYVLGDVRNSDRLDAAMAGVDYVFHAAALKQVPSCENNPHEALLTNAVGAQNVALAARRAGVRVVVALSTDKAVKPINAMGISKAIMEKIIAAHNRFDTETRFCCVRYGNVLGSRGSVVPLFRQRIERGLPIPVTVPSMTRFLITLDQAVELVLHAITDTEGGEIYVRKAPASTLADLAEAVIDVFSNGRRPTITETGMRPGEKLHEVLVNEYELRRAVEDNEHFTILPEYANPPESSAPPGSEYTSENTRQLTRSEIAELLGRMGETDFYV